MSLLMDALKKAEQAKAKSDEGQVSASVEPVAEIQVSETDKSIEANTAYDKPTTESEESFSLEEVEKTPEAETETLEFSIENVEAVDGALPDSVEPTPAEEETVESPADMIEPSAAKTEQQPIEGLQTQAPEPKRKTEQQPEPVEALSPVAEVIHRREDDRQSAQAPMPASDVKPIEAEKPPHVAEDKPDKAVPMLIGKRRSHRPYLWAALIILLMFAGMGYYFFALMDSTQAQNVALVANSDWQAQQIEAEAQTQIPATASEPQKSESINEAPKAISTVAPASVEKQPAVPVKPAAEKTVAPVKQKQATVTPKQALAKQLQISRIETQDPIDRVLNRAYRHYQLDEMDQAEHYYRIALKSDRNNRDALLGLAVIAQREGQVDTASSLYRRLLTLDPKDSVARTGLMSLPAAGSSTQNETRLKLMLGEEPTAAHLHFSLGNEYASRSSWPEAQLAYFRAYRYAPDNGDYAFNLAVSLEQLGQSEAALNYYQRAQEAAADSAVGFDRQSVARRIVALSNKTDAQ